MIFQINKPAATEWMERLSYANEQFVREQQAGMMVEVAHLASIMTLNFLKTLRTLAPDADTAAAITENAAHGISFALIQSLVYTDSPPDHYQQETIN